MQDWLNRTIIKLFILICHIFYVAQYMWHNWLKAIPVLRFWLRKNQNVCLSNSNWKLTLSNVYFICYKTTSFRWCELGADLNHSYTVFLDLIDFKGQSSELPSSEFIWNFINMFRLNRFDIKSKYKHAKHFRKWKRIH